MFQVSIQPSPRLSQISPVEISDTELAWLAGLLEGEGSFLMYRCHKGGREYRYPKIVVGMTDLDVIEHAASLLGENKVYPLPPSKQGERKPAFRAHVSGRKAADLMHQLYPLLGQRRRARIDQILTEYEAQEPTQARRRRSCSEMAANRPRHADGTFKAA
jgi:hypothetical protein